MTYMEFVEAVKDARNTIGYGDDAARSMATLLRDRLRIAKVDSYTLQRLKQELTQFDARTGKWKAPRYE